MMRNFGIVPSYSLCVVKDVSNVPRNASYAHLKIMDNLSFH